MKQWIFGKASPVSLSDKGKQLLKSSKCIVSDFVGETGSPSNGILCSFKSVPIAFWDVPTLNQMVFSSKLWESLLQNQYLKQSMENGSHWGESKHADRDEVYLDEVACRVNKFWLDSNNILLGDVDITDTRKGRDVYTLAKIGNVGISSRGFGELRDMDNGLKEVIPDQYMHVCWDMVAFPAVPDAHMTLITGELPHDETVQMSTELRNLIREAYKRNPKDKALQKLMSTVKVASHGSYEELSKRDPNRFIFDDVRQDWYDKKLGCYESDVTDNGDLWRKYVNPRTGEFDPNGRQASRHVGSSGRSIESALLSHGLKKRRFYA